MRLLRCTVLFFAQARDLAGRDRWQLEVPAGATVSEALDQVLRAHPRLAVLRGQLAIAMDDRYASDATVIRDGCVLAIIPPVSGG